jgi:hypothetical protein
MWPIALFRPRRAFQGMLLASIILTFIVLALALAQMGVTQEARLCAPSGFWKAQFLKWIGCMMAEHENLAGGLIAAGGALFAGWLAWSAVREQIDLERASTEPEVVAYLLPDRRHINFLHLVVANVGRGAARDVSIEMNAEPADFANHQALIPARVRRPILSIMPQDERVHLFFGDAVDLLKEPPLKDFDIHVRFTRLDGKTETNICRTSATDFEGHGRIGIPPEHETAESLKKIADVMNHWSTGFNRLKVETITTAEEQKRRQAAHDAAIARRAGKG